MERKPVIEFRNFSFKYKIQKQPTLQNINLTIFEGEKVLLLGPSGCGKSTLASCINGLIPFSNEGEVTGTCLVNGRDTRKLSVFELSKEVGTVLQDSDAQFVGLSVGEDIAFAMENEMTPRPKMLEEVDHLAGIVQMRDFLTELPFNLSGGQKQKVTLAGVLGDNVNILIFDEPLAALDPQMGVTTIDLIDRMSRETGKTVLIIEHRLEDVLYRPVDRIILMGESCILADLKPNELLTSSLLEESGIREPLYLTAMKYAGCDIFHNPTLCDIEHLELSDSDREKLQAFFRRETGKRPKQPGRESIRLEDVTYAYEPGKDVVKGLSLTIRQGERIAVIGKNGAGKSTLARLITGINRPQRGTICIDGTDYRKMTIREIGERVGYVMQIPNQMLVNDIIKNEVEMALRLRKLPEEEILRRSEAAMKACGIFKMRNWPVDAVSYGQKKRITVASIIALGPDTIILDEPTAGQDYRHYTDFIEFINRLNTTYGKTIVFITHDMHLAIENTDRAVVFADGEIIADDSVYSVLSNDDIIRRANLKQTSLYILAKKLGLPPEQFIEHFIDYEKGVKADAFTQEVPESDPAGTSVNPDAFTQEVLENTFVGTSVNPSAFTQKVPESDPAGTSVYPSAFTQEVPENTFVGTSVNPSAFTQEVPESDPAGTSVNPSAFPQEVLENTFVGTSVNPSAFPQEVLENTFVGTSVNPDAFTQEVLENTFVGTSVNPSAFTQEVPENTFVGTSVNPSAFTQEVLENTPADVSIEEVGSHE